MTNLEKIRAMSLEELALFLCDKIGCYGDSGICIGYDLCEYDGEDGNGLVKWLESEVEE